jgi:energy-coupling factor transporter ATP-binding protein EcfA2
VLRGQLNTLGAGRGSVVFVTGPAGAGKTTLLAEAASLAADRGTRVFCGGGDSGRGQCRSGRSWTLLSPPTSRPWLHELSQSPDQRFWLLRELQESLEKTAHRAPLLTSRVTTAPGSGSRRQMSSDRLITLISADLTRCDLAGRSQPLANGDGRRPKPGHIRLLRGIELDNHRSEGRKHLITSQYSSCRQDVSGARPLS